MNASTHYALDNDLISKVMSIEHNELLRVSTALIGLKFEVETGMYKEKDGKRKKISIDFGDRRPPKSATNQR